MGLARKILFFSGSLIFLIFIPGDLLKGTVHTLKYELHGITIAQKNKPTNKQLLSAPNHCLDDTDTVPVCLTMLQRCCC